MSTPCLAAPRRLLGASALAWSLAAGAAHAQQVVIHNGLAPAIAENVIDAVALATVGGVLRRRRWRA